MTSSSTPSTKAQEEAWHDQWFRNHARKEFPDRAEDFREYFRRVQLASFCDGGWGYWGDTRTEILSMLGDVRGLQVLDYGCGSGQLGIFLAMQGADVCGFDLSREGISVAAWATQKYALDCKFRPLDAEQLDYPDASFDLVIGFGVIHHVIDQLRAALDHG